MASPALAGLVIEFFYTGSSALGNLFPEVFAHEAPTTAICLAATAVSTSLDTTTFVQWPNWRYIYHSNPNPRNHISDASLVTH